MTEFKIVEYNETAAAIAVLREKYCTVFDVTTTKGMTAARETRAEVKGYRVTLEKVRVELKAPALERTRLIDAEAKRITAELLAIEEPIDETIKAEERRKEEEKAAKARAEFARQAEQARIEIEARQAEVARLEAEREAMEAELKAQREEQQRQEQATRTRGFSITPHVKPLDKTTTTCLT